MASYATDPRTGLLVVTQDDGTRLPGMMPEMAPELDAMGMTRATDAGPSANPFASDGGGGAAAEYDAIGAAHDKPQQPLSHAFEGFAPDPRMTPGQSAVAGALGSLPPDPEDFNKDPIDSFQGKAPKNRLAAPSAPAEKPKTGTTRLTLGADGSAVPAGGGGGRARYADVPLSPLRVTARQVEHDRYDPVSGEEADKYHAPLDDQEQRLGFNERRAQLDRDTALLNDEKKYYAEKNLMQAEEQRQAEISKRTRLLESERNRLDTEAKEAGNDPKRYFRDMSVWTKMIAAVSAGLQGAQMGLNGQGGMPPVIGLLQELNKQDIEDQKLKMESAVARGKLANDRYEQAVKLWGDPDAAEMQMERDKLALTDSWLARQAAAQQADGAAQEQFAAMRQQIQERRLQLDDELSLRGKAKVVDQLQATPKQLVGGGGGGAARAKPHPQRAKLVEQITQLDNVVAGVSRIDGLETSGKFAEAEALGNALVPQTSQALGSGQPTGDEFGTFKTDVLGDPGSRVYRHIPGTSANTGKERRAATIGQLNDKRARLVQELENLDQAGTPDAPVVYE